MFFQSVLVADIYLKALLLASSNLVLITFLVQRNQMLSRFISIHEATCKLALWSS